ncbi:hypothetical protein F0U44_15005 [Nocardioides humilatus]|uniref:Uncharacterized protein n=1 Tax=Nocardioides humilatus TaxID=2607660 RepID=A0A5B1LBA3_9ACTN|nr:hypothetical protein [Nocardioides humilatus]KAA1417942.1 hypothetical protein F0U44_15005 [Nocardioides humilatus]
MEVSAAQSPVRDVYGRMRRLSAAIDDPDSTFGQRWRWTDEYVDLAAELAGQVGARQAAGAEMVDRGTRRREAPDGFTPRVGPRADGTDLYL